MFKDSPEGQTNYCPHTKDGTICKKCLGVKPEGVGGWVERIVIEYANLSGRESANRAEFRERIEVIISSLILQEKAKWLKEWTLTDKQLDLERVIDNQNEVIKELSDNFENRLEEYRNSPDVWKNVGISKWRNWGEQNGYFKFFEDKTKQEALAEERNRVREGINGLEKYYHAGIGKPETIKKRVLQEVRKLLTLLK